mgnify:CR=1 FL=1
MSSLRNTVFRAITGLKQADVSGSPDGDVKGMLLSVGGASSRTKSGIDLSRAAQALGVSRRTVERWVRTADTGRGQRPSAEHAKALAAKARQAASTKAGRRQLVKRLGMVEKVTAQGVTVTIAGEQGPRNRDYMRPRTVQRDVYGEDAAQMVQAWQDGGEKGFVAWATEFWGNDYVPEWRFETIEAVDIEIPGDSR